MLALERARLAAVNHQTERRRRFADAHQRDAHGKGRRTAALVQRSDPHFQRHLPRHSITGPYGCATLPDGSAQSSHLNIGYPWLGGGYPGLVVPPHMMSFQKDSFATAMTFIISMKQ